MRKIVVWGILFVLAGLLFRGQVSAQVPTTSLTCGWCGSICKFKYPSTVCAQLAPVAGMKCQVVSGLCKMVPRPTATPTIAPTCGWCGSICKFKYPTTVCTALAPVSGMKCQVVSGVCKMVPKPTVTPTIAPTCGWCGSLCKFKYPTTACPTLAPISGMKCQVVSGLCKMVPRPTATPTKRPTPTPIFCDSLGKCPTGFQCIKPASPCLQGQVCYFRPYCRKVTATATPTSSPKCIWCGSTCKFLLTTAGCPSTAPLPGKMCRVVGTSCQIVPKPTATPGGVTYCDALGKCPTGYQCVKPGVCPTGAMCDLLVTKPYCVKIVPTAGPKCGWCGSTCKFITAGMACPALAPVSGMRCLVVSGLCKMVPRPTATPSVTYCDVNRNCPVGYSCVSPVCPPGANCQIIRPYCVKVGPTPTGQTLSCEWCGDKCVNSQMKIGCADVGPPAGKSCVVENAGCVIKDNTGTACSKDSDCANNEYCDQLFCKACTPRLDCMDENPPTCVVDVEPGAPPFCPKVTGNEVEGDADGDGDADMDDFEIWKNEYLEKMETKKSDFDKNGMVDMDDFEIWKKSYLNNSN